MTGTHDYRTHSFVAFLEEHEKWLSIPKDWSDDYSIIALATWHKQWDAALTLISALVFCCFCFHFFFFLEKGAKNKRQLRVILLNEVSLENVVGPVRENKFGTNRETVVTLFNKKWNLFSLWQACYLRGLNAANANKEEMQEYLNKWLAISTHTDGKFTVASKRGFCALMLGAKAHFASDESVRKPHAAP